MGASTTLTTLAMRIILLLIVAAAFVSAEKFDYEDTTPSMEAPEESLLSVVKELRQATDNTPFSVHGMRIEDHANLIQKARAYKHSFGARNALRAAIRALVSELTSGHNHDRNALNNERNAGHNAIRNASNRGKGVTRRYREKACPTKKAQVEAEAARNSAKNAMNAIKRRRVCNLSTTWYDMNIKGSAPKFGGALRNRWDKARADYLRKLAKYNAAVRAYNKAAREHAGSMSAFKATVKAEASNAHAACRNAHKAYEILKRDVASNVATRKQVYIASKVITCYINNLSNNGGAKSCADRARRASTSRWNINAAKMSACQSKVALQATLGPLSWRPSKRNCHANHWNERGIKERSTKERKTKERNSKERNHKERNNKERNSKERNNKERSNKANERKQKSNSLEVRGCRGANAANGNGRCYIHAYGMYYRTLAAADPYGRYGSGKGKFATCENQFLNVPHGCSISPDNGRFHHLARSYGWQTHVLCASNGACMGTTQYRRGQWHTRSGGIRTRHHGGRLQASSTGCSYRILLQCNGHRE